MLDSFINRAKFDALPPDLQSIVAMANGAANQLVLSEFTARNNAALARLVGEHGVILRAFPNEVLGKLGRVSAEVLEELTAADPLSRKVYESILRFRKQAAHWSKLSEQAYLYARRMTTEDQAQG